MTQQLFRGIAERAVSLIAPGSVVGLGTGQAASAFIHVLEESGGPQVTPGTGNFGAFPELAERIGEDYDFDAVRRQREYDLLHAHDHVP